MNVPNLIKERADLIARIAEIDATLALVSDPAKAIEIDTRRNLRNTAVGYYDNKNEWHRVEVYETADLRTPENEGAHGGYITAADAAAMKNDSQIDEDHIRIVSD